jgi:23S rRNA (adenine2503-C2)-methyltransferase
MYERSSRGVPLASDAWAMTPFELESCGVRSGQAVFAELHRPWRWGSPGPALAGRAARALSARLELPSIRERTASADGSSKLVLSFGSHAVEAVHMPRQVRSGQRATLCVSSQVGCAMGCTFCATASMGFHRQLSAGEIVAQVLVVLRELGPRHPGELTLVFMGMGEPLHNLRSVARAIEIVCAPGGLGLSPRRITVSTSGLVPEIDELGSLPVRPLLAVSLNATTDAARSALMPINRRYPLAALRAALERYPWRPREHATIEYVLLQGENDSDDDAARLADFCAPFPHHINVIPFNQHPGARFRRPDDEAVARFARAILARRPALVTVRRSRGQDVQGACGQLVSSERLGQRRSRSSVELLG